MARGRLPHLALLRRIPIGRPEPVRPLAADSIGHASPMLAEDRSR